jgi:hypothetical protein
VTKARTKTALISSPVLADGRICHVGGAKGQWLLMIEPAPAGFKLLATAEMGIARCSSMAIADSRLYVRPHRPIACHDLTHVAVQRDCPDNTSP